MNRTEGKNDYVILVSGHRNPDIDSLASAVALAELRRRQSVPSRRSVELLLLLLARREGAIDTDTWDRQAYQHDPKMLNAYYGILESAGYAVSDAEMKGLEQ